MEWSGGQQLRFLAESGVIGGILGILFDCISGCFRDRRYRKRLFWFDLALGPLAALITFFGALVIMDGQMHPVLFLGIGFGFLAEHFTIGLWLGRGVCYAHRFLHGKIGVGVGWLDAKIYRLFRSVGDRRTAKAEKIEKTRKKHRFFQKNT